MEPSPSHETPYAAQPSETGAFELLHAGVQRQLWRMQWRELRPLQVQAIRKIMWAPHDLLISAATASGKTEAAFLPVLSKIADEPTGSVRALYIGPLKALINDQFSRIEELCGYLEMPVYRWHGDVPDSQKAKLVQSPGGVLLITPESLESLFVNRSRYMTSLFAGLRFVVIDELHSFLDQQRGLHLQSLLQRLRSLTILSFRIIGLSATIGDPDVARRYLNGDHPDRVETVTDQGSSAEIKFRIHGYCLPPYTGDRLPVDDSQAEQEIPDDQPPEEMLRAASDIVKHCAGRANLVFANAKGDVEEFADLCKRIGQGRNLPDQFLVHHGSLSAAIREDAEATMKSGATATTFCSATLEMGIDIGSVAMVGQIGSPWSVSSMMQRMGRSGRKPGQPRVMRVYIQCMQPDAEADVFQRLHLELVQAVAITELMLERWLEPAQPPVCALSTLTQQVISVVAETGGIRANELYERLCHTGAFRDIEAGLFAHLLRALAAADVVEQMAEGDLILGLRGERIRKDKGFYAVFPTPEEYSVLHNGVLLGTLECAYKKDDHLLFAGRRWRIVEADHDRLELHVVPARGWKRPRFGGGIGDVHPRVRQKTRQILAEGGTFAYLDLGAQSLLNDARHAASTSQLLDRALVPLGPRRTAVMTWTGTRIQQTIQAMFAAKGMTAEDEVIALVLNLSEIETRAAVIHLVSSAFSPEALARFVPNRCRHKYDGLLTDALLDTVIARGWLDVAGATTAIRAVATG